MTENVHSTQPRAFEQLGSASRLVRGQLEEQTDIRHELQRVFGELLGDPIGRVRDDDAAASWRLRLREEVANEVEPKAAIGDVGGDHGKAVISQRTDDRTVAGSGLPDPSAGEERRLGRNQRLNRGRLRGIETALRGAP